MQDRRPIVSAWGSAYFATAGGDLEATGSFEVCIENFSTASLETARRFHPDLILLDYIMPEMDGGDVTATLKNDPFLRRMPIVLLTELVSNKEASPDGTVPRGGQVMLAKPAKRANLLKCIEEPLRTAE